ncbi:Ku protein [Streptomyces nigrescens]|uniref:Ku protein n=1 Tax=Streptomyces nigrescens TaxID=1920 RepID=UPI003807A020
MAGHGLLRPGRTARGHLHSYRGSRARSHLVHAVDGGRVRHRRVCELDGREVGPEETARGWEAPDGRTVVIRDEDLEALPLPTKRVQGGPPVAGAAVRPAPAQRNLGAAYPALARGDP